FIVSYGDIIYEPVVLEQLLAADHAISVIIDRGWELYWKQRFENVLDDAETLQVDKSGCIISIGQKPLSIEQIEGQYIGLTAFKGEGVEVLRSVYHQAQLEAVGGQYPLRGERPFCKLYMTDILQGIIDSGFPVHQVPVWRAWLEIDSLKDIELAERSIEIDGDTFKIKI
ncbi:phosphocholine cytidylyltransferase family protein, partial [Chloroflexota bacterium]